MVRKFVDQYGELLIGLAACLWGFKLTVPTLHLRQYNNKWKINISDNNIYFPPTAFNALIDFLSELDVTASLSSNPSLSCHTQSPENAEHAKAIWQILAQECG